MDGYHVCEEDKTKVKSLFNVTNDEVERKIELLEQWTNKSSHLPPESRDRSYLAIMLLRSKFDEDLAKSNIENYFKYMKKFPEFFKKLGQFKPSEEVGVAIASTKLTPSFERIGILKLVPENMDKKKFDINQMLLVIVTTGVIMYNNDYVPSVRFLLDFKGLSLMDVIKVNLRDLYKIVSISEKILRIRITGIELLNAPKIATILLSIAKVLLKPKMFSRVTVHKDLSSVHENIPKECLPCDYGGDLESTNHFIGLWDNIVDIHKPFFEKFANYFEDDANKNNS